MNALRPFAGLSAFLVLGLALGGCPKKSPAPEQEAPAAEGEGGAQTPSPETAAPSIEIGTDYAGTPSLGAVHFDYMAATLRADARDTLKANAATLKAVLKAAPSAQIRVEGHCDDRGTLEYNLALGQRRANAVRDYYLSFGIPKAVVKTVSFGEERPTCTEETESCWAENRRGETTLRAAQPVSVPLNAGSGN